MTVEESNGWCPRCGSRGRCPHCHWCVRTEEEGHSEFCPVELETYPAPVDGQLCWRCDSPMTSFRLVRADELFDEEGNECWEMVCPPCGLKAEAADGPEHDDQQGGLDGD